MMRKFGSDNFAKLMMIIAIFVAGALIGAATGGWSNLQGWTSALSGWFAGGAAIWIGLTQLKPLLADQKTRRQQQLMERAEECVVTYSNIANSLENLSGALAYYTRGDNPVHLLPRDTAKQGEAQMRFLKIIDEPNDHLDRLELLTLKLKITPETSRELSKAKHALHAAISHLEQRLFEFKSHVVGKILSMNKSNDAPPTVEEMTFVLKTQKARSKMAEVWPAFECVQECAGELYGQLAKEQARAEASMYETRHATPSADAS